MKFYFYILTFTPMYIPGNMPTKSANFPAPQIFVLHYKTPLAYSQVNIFIFILLLMLI